VIGHKTGSLLIGGLVNSHLCLYSPEKFLVLIVMNLKEKIPVSSDNEKIIATSNNSPFFDFGFYVNRLGMQINAYEE